MKTTISIIIPVYNAEKTISRCLDSLVHQTYKDLQIIIIDDGSTDASFSICQKYQENDKRIDLLHQPNAGQSAARNLGMDHAKGEYISFVDADDYVKTDTYEKVINSIKNADALFFGYVEKYEEVQHEKVVIPSVCGMMYMKDALYYCFTPLDYSTVVWNKVFKKELISQVRFDTSIYQAEDDLFFAQASLHLKTVVLFNEPLYYYIQRKQSISHSFKHLEKWASALDAKEKVLSLLAHNKNCYSLLHAKIYNDIFPLVWNSYIAKEKKFSIELLCRIKPYKAFFLQAKEYSDSKKTKYTLLELMMKMNLPSSFVQRLGSLTTYKIKAFLFKGKRL